MFHKQSGELENRLFRACSRGDLIEVTNCLQQGANVNKVCSNGRTSLGLAAQLGNIDILRLFLHKPNLPVVDNAGTSETTTNLGYFIVIHNESTSTTISNDNDSSRIPMDFERSELAVKGIDFDDFNDPLIQRLPWMKNITSDEEGRTPEGMENLEWDTEITGDDVACDQDPWAELYLWYANILSQTGALLEEKPPPDDIDGEDQFGCAPLHYAAIEGKREAVILLINAGCKVNVKDSDNFTPLHLAASKDRPDIVELLLENGAYPHVRSSDGITALHVAASRGLVENVRSLIAFGAGVNTVDLSDRTPLYLAVSRKQYEVVNYLIRKGAKVNLAEIHGYTPLFEAVCNKDVTLVEILLAAGAKITQSHYPLHYAIMHQHEAMVRVLVKAGCLLNVRDLSGNTPLMTAARVQSCNLVKLLLEHGASVQSANSVTMQTVLQEAICFMKRDCEQFLRMFTILEKYGWDWSLEKNALSYALVQKNYHAIAVIIRRWDVVENETALMEALIFRGDKFLVELFILAGFNLHNLETSDSLMGCAKTEPALEFVMHCLRQPLSLKDLCRIRIRRSLKKRIYDKLAQLYLPSPLMSYLRLEDLPCPCQLKH